MKKIITLLFAMSVFVTACTFEKASPLPAGCTATMFYAVDIKPIISSKCSIPGCHEPTGSGTGDFTTYAGVKAKVDDGTINNRVFLVKDMPQSGFPPLTEDEKSKLKCWMQQGAPDN